MYPSTYSSSGPYTCYPYSSNSYPFFAFLNPENASSSNGNNNNNNNVLLHDPLVHVPYNIPTHHYLHNTPIIQETLTNLAVSDAHAITMPKQDQIISGGNGVYNRYGFSSFLTKKPAKKDRHSKIYTSQGLRDRRVRLSIGISRKFFDLQDMLGFDKASNTLEWLFNKSKKAIKELARSKNSNIIEGDTKSFSYSSDCEDCKEVVSGIKNEKQGTMNANHDNLNLQQQGLDSNVVEDMRKLKSAQKEPACVRTKMKESREKARERARERTSNKMSNTTSNNGRVMQVQDLKKKCIATTENNTETLQQLRSPLQLEDCARSPNNMIQSHPHPHLVLSSEAPRHDNFNVIEESIMIRRKLKPSMVSSSHHHHQLIQKEASFNNTDYNSTNLSPNWDNGSNGDSEINGRSTFCTIATMNLSTGLQIFGKSWE
ncbi:unnamed protein product [Lupinus luteus]|uniref:Uncharacterized protein n=1 Tax=Lupinus luteus TaxID=3873 RepID=A0AAV1XKN6_LUPLU